MIRKTPRRSTRSARRKTIRLLGGVPDGTPMAELDALKFFLKRVAIGRDLLGGAAWCRSFVCAVASGSAAIPGKRALTGT